MDDGDVDLYVANDSTPNFLWRNEGDGTFAEVGLQAQVAYGAMDTRRLAWGWPGAITTGRPSRYFFDAL